MTDAGGLIEQMRADSQTELLRGRERMVEMGLSELEIAALMAQAKRMHDTHIAAVTRQLAALAATEVAH